jgi:hypothetical protein
MSAGYVAPRSEEVRVRREDRYGEPGFVERLASRLEPEEGWASLPLVLILAGTMAWSIADARWILGHDNLTSFVIPIAILAALWGYLSARLDMSPWLAQLLGAAIGAFVLIEAVGSVIPDAQPGLVGWFNATANSVTQAYLDLTWRHQLSTNQYGHFCLFVGIVVWGTAQAGSYDIFGYHRAVSGVLLMAVILVANMCLTYRDQFPALVLFSAAGLGVLLRAHAAEERSSWLRHRIWRGGDFRTPHVQGGLGFASAAICGALVITTIASPAPLADAWPGVTDNFRDFATWLSGYLPSGGQSRISGGSDFGTSSTIGWSFNTGPDQVFTVRVSNQALSPTHWRVIAYDSFRSTGWTVGSGTSETNILATSQLAGGTADLVTSLTQGRAQVSYVVHVQDKSLKHLIVANEPDVANVGVSRVVVGSSPDSEVVWYPTGALDYTVTADVPNLDPSGNGLTEWRLRHAGAAWPPGLLARYTQGADLVGSDGKYLLQLIEKWAADQGGYAIDAQTGHFANEYDAAKAIQEYLRDPGNFTYSANIADLARQCATLSTVDCFALTRKGFCEQYATTMTMLMRMEGYPARYVQGFLPGRLQQYSQIQQVTAEQRHAWVEVFFPGYGWVPFDPTGSVGQPTELPAGSEVSPSPSPNASASASGAEPRRTPQPGGGEQTTPPPPSGSGTGILVPLAIVLVVGLALFLLWRRRPRRLHAPNTVYRGIVRLASRLGYRPLATQTVYEYTGMLADIVPGARDPLGVVATAEVEVAYGRRQLGADRLTALNDAERRVRAALYRLLLKLPGRRPKPAGARRGGRARG